ncbi:MAG: HPr family phosphocarrier protein [Lachnospiraceae bacterium]|nr:HPr family phosphocarrier protein [Lachnospiraceae bacterium]
MISEKVLVKNPSGFHLRPAGMFCQMAEGYKSKIHFNKGNNRDFNAKSILSVLGAGVMSGDEVEIICDGEDEKEALDALIELVNSGFGEKV